MSKNEMIDIQDVARIFNLSIEGVRKYKRYGLFEACHKIGRKDFYNMQEILSRKALIQSYKQEGFSLNKIKEKINDLKLKQSLKMNLDHNNGLKKVLIIEDEEMVVDILKKILRKYFKENVLEIYDARTGYSGIENAEIINPDLTILDVGLPGGKTGREVYDQLKGHTNTSKIKFIIISGIEDFSDNEEFRSSNDKFFMKPIKTKKFLDTVKKFLEIETDSLAC